MSTIIYHNNRLYGDRKHTRLNIPREFYMGGPKIFISKDKQFAYGMAGVNIVPDDVKIIEAEIRRFTESLFAAARWGYQQNMDLISKTLMPELSKRYRLNSFVVMTTDKAYRFLRESAEEANTLFSDTRALSVGTMAAYALGLIDSGISMDQVYQYVSDADQFTSAEHDVIEASQLKPFIIEGLTTEADIKLAKKALGHAHHN